MEETHAPLPAQQANATARPLAAGHETRERRGALPLQAQVEPAKDGWLIRLPMRAEMITIDRQAVVVEQVVVRAETVQETVHLDASVRREELRMGTEGDVEVASPEDAVARSRAAEGQPAWRGFPNTPR